MKALKEKRISLRSLWRRGLVILSLFALVFASCGDSSSGGGTETYGGPRVASFTVKEGPANNQYVGQPVDLTGVILEVTYADGQKELVEYKGNEGKITTNPRVVTGWHYQDWNKNVWFNEMTLYDVVYAGIPAEKPLRFGPGTGIDVYPIATQLFWEAMGYSDTWKNWGISDWDMMNISGIKDMGLHLTGAASLAGVYAYVDDEVFDFAGLTLEADYLINYTEFVKDTKKADVVVPPKIERKSVSFSDITWEIRPRYEKGKLPNEGFVDGYLFVTVGQDYRYERDYDWDSEWSAGSGVTTLVPLEKVWTVKDKDAIRLVDAEDVSAYFLWEENTKEEWIKKLGEKAALEVTYTDNTTKTWFIKDLAVKSNIYLNANPDEGYLDYWTEEGVYQGPLDFDIMTLKYPFTKKSVDLGIILYYRGAQYQIPVNVYATLVKVEVTPSITFWPDPSWDNDVDNGPGGPLELSKQIEVKALYSAINDASNQEYVTLTYWHDPSVNRPYGTGPYYLFGTDPTIEEQYEQDYVMEAGETYGGDSTYLKGYQKYLNNLLKGKETTTNVTVRHNVTVYTENPVWYNGVKVMEGLTTYYEDVFVNRYNWGGPWTWVSPWVSVHAYGMLPNGWSPYDSTMTKAPFKDAAGNLVPRRNFGPKLSQTKKAKTSVTWVNKKP